MDLFSASRDEPRADAQATALKARVGRLGLTWFPDRPESHTVGRALVLGVAAWSIYDVRLLCLVADARARATAPALDVAVFDVDELLSSAELRRIFPGIGKVFHVPVAGYWEAGQLKEVASGFAARELIGRLLGIDPSSGLEHSTAV
jgi:hypothetical protein